MKKKEFKKRTCLRGIMVLTLTLAGGLVLSGSFNAKARQIGYLNSFTVVYGTSVSSEKFTDPLTKAVTNRDAVVNLADDSGTAWVTVTVRNSNNESRGSTNLQRGQRKEFDCTGTAGYNYKLGVRKRYNTGGGKVTINGTWSPDAY